MVTSNKPCYVLLIEDNPGDRLLITEFLQERFENIQLKIAGTYKETLALLEGGEVSFDTILLDLSLPDKQGEPLIKDLLAHSRVCCPVIILSGYADLEFSIQSISFGVSDYLLKDDLTSSLLYKSILYASERWRSRQQLEESEKKFHLLFNASPQPTWVYDLETLLFTQVNFAATKLYGFSEADFLRMKIYELHPPEDKDRVLKAVEESDSRENIFVGEFRQLKKNGEEVMVEIYSTYLEINNRPSRSVVAVDVTERNKSERKLTQAIIKTQEDERYEIGSELHDNVCQILAGSLLNFSMVSNHLPPSSEPLFKKGIQYIKLATDEIRNLSHRLAPAFFDEVSLHDAFEQLLNTFTADKRFEIHLNFSHGLEEDTLDRELQLNLYRILQEQLNNIVKYAKAAKIEVNLTVENGQLTLHILDNGKGFDAKRVTPGIGFANMKRRAEHFSGHFSVQSAPGQGCAVKVSFPVAAVSKA